jgi:hypothetical protein
MKVERELFGKRKGTSGKGEGMKERNEAKYYQSTL